MPSREALKQQLDNFSDEQLQQIADFMEFLQFRKHNASPTDARDDTPKAEVLADFRQAWHEAMTGQGIPVAELWQELEDE
jgi:hypothetical protein